MHPPENFTIKDVLEKPFKNERYNCCRSKSWERRKEEDHRERRDEMNMTQVEKMITIITEA